MVKEYGCHQGREFRENWNFTLNEGKKKDFSKY